MCRPISMLVLFVALAPLGCGGGDEPSEVPDVAASDTTTDISSFDSTPGDDAGDAGTDPTTDSAAPDASGDVAPDAGFGGDLCDEDGDCAAGYDCVRPEAEAPVGLCTIRCVDDTDCPSGSVCSVFGASGGGAERWCVPTELCLDADGDGYGYGADCRGRDCDDGSSRINPAADEICDGIDNDCDERVDDNPVEDNDVCRTGLAGACSSGRYLCDAGVLVCEPDGRDDETCDGLDNDCDGATDEGEVCGDTCCVDDNCNGACAFGTLSEGGVCEPPISVGAEVCDGLDNDCDGQTDESDPALDADCDSPEPGICRPGRTRCDGGALVCEPLAEPRAEVCNGLDDDCNGAVDEGGVCAGEPCCYLDDCDGVCGTATTDSAGTCVEPGGYGAETCDGVDNDCDGGVDEGGVCAGEPCCYLDDCDGVCGTARTDARGACVEPASFGSDVCDGLDNDCDGDVDDSDPAVGDRCNTGEAGVCAVGTRACAAGRLRCDPEVVPSSETCDGLDNDCDGDADEGVTRTWYRDVDADGAGAASSGTREACSAPIGYVASNDDCDDRNRDIRPGVAERPGDGVDQNCDRREVCFGDGDGDGYHDGIPDVMSADLDCTDDGEAGAGVPGGDCNDRNPEVNPGRRELCNGVDDDCDAAVDEGRPVTVWYPDDDRDGFGDRDAGVESCAPLPGYITVGGDCDDENPSVHPGVEFDLCDGVDNDCDRAMDEDALEVPIGCCCDFGPCQQGERLEDVVRTCLRGREVCQIRGPVFETLRCDLIP